MEEDGKLQEEVNDMFLWDCGSLSLWADGNGGGMIEVGAEVEEGANGEGSKKRERHKELGKTVIGGEGEGEGGIDGDKEEDKEEEPFEFRIKTERERRKKMRSMFGTLLSLVPNLSPKADKATIVDETVNYIKTLEQRLQVLQTKKQEKLKEANGINFNPFSPSPASMMPPQFHPQPQMVAPYEPAMISREAFLADHYMYSSSSSRSITPSNSNAATPKGHNTASCYNNTWGSPPIVMIDTPPNASDLKPNPSPTETPVRLTLSPSSVTFRTFTSKNVVVCVCGQEANFNICGARKPGFYDGICSVLEKYRLEVKSFHVSSEEHSNRTMLMIQARATALLDQYPAEDIYKAAAVEMVHLISF